MRKHLRGIAIAAALAIACTAVAAQQVMQGTAFASAARTSATYSTADLTNAQWRGIKAVVRTSAFTSGTFTPKIQAKDPVSGQYYDLLAGAAIAGTGTIVLTVYPGIAVSANVSASDVLPGTFRLQLIGAATPSATNSVSFTLLP
jgi:hypothetical protein